MSVPSWLLSYQRDRIEMGILRGTYSRKEALYASKVEEPSRPLHCRFDCVELGEYTEGLDVSSNEPGRFRGWFDELDMV
jgi:hypothetical protein